ncbi:MAG: DUF2267 domain-containing protein [Solirubrobacterales bacterium]
MVQIIDRSVEKANIWLKDMAEELETDDRQAAYRALRATLHAVRDRLPVEEAAQLAAQMPLLIRGIYYENWRPSATPIAYRDIGAFLDRVAGEAGLAGETEASFAVSATVRVLRRHISGGELDDVAAAFPEGLKSLVEG